MIDSEKRVHELLGRLEQQLELAKAAPTGIAICGGSALLAMGLMTRGGTKDVDAFAFVHRLAGGGIALVKSDPLPNDLQRAIKIVAGDFHLPEDWLNAGPASIVDLGVPNGLEFRLHPVSYGDRLTVWFLDRLDQIHFKLYAAVDQGGNSRHMIDLKALNPTSAELDLAARWTMTHDPSDGYKQMLTTCLRYMGHGNVADRL